MSTPRQLQLLRFIKLYQLDHGGVSPSFEEMKDALGIKSKSGVHSIISALVEQGLIRRLPERARSIQIVEQDQVKPTILLKEILEHWYYFGTSGIEEPIERARTAMGAPA